MNFSSTNDDSELAGKVSELIKLIGIKTYNLLYPVSSSCILSYFQIQFSKQLHIIKLKRKNYHFLGTSNGTQLMITV